MGPIPPSPLRKLHEKVTLWPVFFFFTWLLIHIIIISFLFSFLFNSFFFLNHIIFSHCLHPLEEKRNWRCEISWRTANNGEQLPSFNFNIFALFWQIYIICAKIVSAASIPEWDGVPRVRDLSISYSELILGICRMSEKKMTSERAISRSVHGVEKVQSLWLCIDDST